MDKPSFLTRMEGSRETLERVKTAVEKGGIDLVILDVMLPEVDGLSACRNIRLTSRVPSKILCVYS